jgi:hypothetical protein
MFRMGLNTNVRRPCNFVYVHCTIHGYSPNKQDTSYRPHLIVILVPQTMSRGALIHQTLISVAISRSLTS